MTPGSSGLKASIRPVAVNPHIPRNADGPEGAGQGTPVFRPAPSAGGGRNATEHDDRGGHSAVRGPVGRGAGLKTGAPGCLRRTAPTQSGTA